MQQNALAPIISVRNVLHLTFSLTAWILVHSLHISDDVVFTADTKLRTRARAREFTHTHLSPKNCGWMSLARR